MMKGFALNNDGDLLIENGEIKMTFDADLICQKVKNILKTNKGEWFLNVDEGITFDNILGKHVDREALIQSEVADGLTQVDETFALTAFNCEFNDAERTATVTFSAANADGQALENQTIAF